MARNEKGRIEQNADYVVRESYTVKQIREAFAKYASKDEWGIPNFYEDGLIAALRGEYDAPSSTPMPSPQYVEDACRTCSVKHPLDGCADVGCNHNCQAEVSSLPPEERS